MLEVSPLYRDDFSKANWFRDTLGGKTTDDKAKNFAGTHVSDPTIDPVVSKVFGEKRLGNSFSAVVKDKDGEVVGVMSNRAGIRWIDSEFVSLYKKIRGSGLNEVKIHLLDKDGNVVIDYNGFRQKNPDIVEYDFEEAQENFIENGLVYPKLAQAGKSGWAEEIHFETKTPNLIGYAAIGGSKFIPSLG
jgi:methyl-accepting chemotaxis protein